jgi:hypothetical protein
MSFVQKKKEEINQLIAARNAGNTNQDAFFNKYGYRYCCFQLPKPKYRPIKDWYCMKIAPPGLKMCWTHAYTRAIIDEWLTKFFPIAELKTMIWDFIG